LEFDGNQVTVSDAMKTKLLTTVSAVGRLQDWIQAPSPPCSLVVGAMCNCDLPALEQKTCRLLNRVRELGSSRFNWLDYEDIRFLSGQPGLRLAITERAGVGGDRYHRWNDSEVVLRGLASMGGLVLGGQAALDATHELPNVCRVMLCNCMTCRESDLHAVIHPDFCGPGEVPEEVMQHFLDWMAGHPYGALTSSPGAAEVGLMKESLREPALRLS
jgi:hypothetical protein